MSARGPNMVLLIIDSLRYDRMGVSGYKPALTPTLDRLAREGINCPNAFSVGCPTQLAFPGMFASRLPLDDGGYDHGIQFRDSSFVEALKSAGYETFGISTAMGSSSHYGYARGFDNYADLVDIQHLLRDTYATAFAERLDKWDRGLLSDDDIVEALNGKYRKAIHEALHYLDDQDAARLPQFGRNRNDWRRAITAEQEILRNDPLAIGRRMRELGRDYHVALGEPAVTDSIRKRLKRRAYLRGILNKRLFLISSRKSYRARDANRLVQKFLEERNADKPFFLMIHYFDLHESKLLIPNLTFARLATLPRDVRNAMKGRPKETGGGLLYDIGLSGIDHDISNLFATLGRYGAKENTNFVITADHGAEVGYPFRNIRSDLSRFFFDDFVHVPLILHGPDVSAEENTNLVSHLDLAPTVLDMAGAKIPSAFRGRPLGAMESNPRDHVLFENAGSGECDIDSKTLYIGVRTPGLKVVYAADGFKERERDVFDLEADRYELNNLVDSRVRMKERAKCRSIARQRLKEIRTQARAMPQASRVQVTAE